MKSRILTFATTMILLAELAFAVRLNAQVLDESGKQTHYHVVNLGNLSGTSSVANSVNNLSWVAGSANVTADTVHAAVWLYGLRFDLGTLGGPNSQVNWPVKNTHGQIVGNAETSSTDPLNENVCRFGTGNVCLGFLGQWGVMNPLPTLGGNNSYAAGDNNRGQVVGWAETNVHDSTCLPGHVLQYEAVIWGPEKGQIQQLPPLQGDPDGAAVGINDNGQVVGISGPCGDDDGLGAHHAVLWQNGTVTNLGNLGGKYFNTGVAINSKGVVVGFSDLPGDSKSQPNFYAFIWTRDSGINDLGTLTGDFFSEATGINEQGQIVGESCDVNF